MASDDKDATIIVDIVDINCETLINDINQMEVLAGYTPSHIEVDGHLCVIYQLKPVYSNDLEKDLDLLSHGDWAIHKEV